MHSVLHLPAAQYLIIQQVISAANAVATRLADAHMQRSAAQMEPREVTATK